MGLAEPCENIDLLHFTSALSCRERVRIFVIGLLLLGDSTLQISSLLLLLSTWRILFILHRLVCYHLRLASDDVELLVTLLP